MPTINEQARAFAAQLANDAPTIADVFAREQAGWRDSGVPAGAVAAGDRLPPFALPDADGTPVTLDDLLAGGPAVLVFYRGGWCPYCNIALRAYQADLLPQLGRYGARLVAISPQTPRASARTQARAGLEFTVLSDAGSHLARQLGIAFQPAAEVVEAQRSLGLDLGRVNVDGAPDLPMPTVLVVDRSRVVRFADTQADYTARTEVADIVAALDVLAHDAA
ncbi:MAG TPA: peroxiredoxin-like family protein [Acidimicrobiales bacterium]|nr:peroxiredoxin-like family protein [Acidimicrobiales bacterium]